MNKFLLTVHSVFLSAALAAQCTPDPSVVDDTFGVWPDTTENFMPGTVGVFYTDTLNLLVPTDAELIDPEFPTIDIDSIQLVSVVGLPPGLTTICNSQTAASCTYLPDVLGCGLIQGVPTTPGTYPIELNVVAWFTLIFPLSQEVSFGGYEITILEDNTAVLGRSSAGISGVRNIPNPFATRTTIEFNAGVPGAARVRVFSLVGEEVWSENIQARAGTNKVLFDAGEIPAGVYLYKIECGSHTYTGRMALQR